MIERATGARSPFSQPKVPERCLKSNEWILAGPRDHVGGWPSLSAELRPRESNQVIPERYREESTNVVSVMVMGELEVLLSAPLPAKSRSDEDKNVPPKQGLNDKSKEGFWHALWNPFYVTILGLAALGAQKLYLERGIADRDRRIGEQRTLVTQLLPLSMPSSKPRKDLLGIERFHFCAR